MTLSAMINQANGIARPRVVQCIDNETAALKAGYYVL